MIDQITRSISHVCFDHPQKKKEENRKEMKRIELELAPTCGRIVELN